MAMENESRRPVDLIRYRVEKEVDPLIGQLGAPELADLLLMFFQCWLADLHLESLQPEVRVSVLRIARSTFVQSIGRMAHLVETHKRFGGTVSWQDVCDELDRILPESDKLLGLE